MKFTRKSLVITLILLTLAVTGVIAIWHNSQQKTESEQSNQSNTNQPQNEADIRNNPKQTDHNQEEPSVDPKPQPTKRQVSPTITNIRDGDRDPITVRAIVGDETKGTCTLVVTKAGQKTITKSAPLGLVATSYACQGFNIAQKDFPVKGAWEVKVKFISDTAEGTSDTKIIMVE